MSFATHPERDDLVAYTLGALEPAAEAAVADHVETCEKCAQDLLHYQPAVNVLTDSVEPQEPPPSLRENLMATVYDEAAPEFRAAPKRRRSVWASFLTRPATGLAVAAIAAAGVGGFIAADDDGGGGDRTVPITDANGDAGGEVIVSEGQATLQMTGMAQLKQGAVYQVWVGHEDGTVSPSATFLPHEDGTATAAVPEADTGGEQVMVTIEDGPNRTDPSLPPIMSVGLK